MKVTPTSKTLTEVLRGNFIRIPRFQRPYDWDRENITEFWNDVKDRSDPEYFMGSLVVFTDQKERNLISLVDGQQRITTITMMLAIIRNILDELGEDGLSSAIHDLIETRDLDNKSRYVLEHDPADRYFQYRIQARSPDTKLQPDGPQQENLQSAFRFLDNTLRQHIKVAFDGDKNKAISYLKHLRDCLLQMHFISVELDNEDDAYLIFETLNTRGKDLRISDLLKNHFMRLLPAKIKGADQAKNTWSDLIAELTSVTISIDPDSFLLHYWLAHKAYVSKASLFIHYKDDIKKGNAKARLDDLRSAARTYIRCVAPNDVTWTKEQRPLQESVQALRTFGVAQAAPLMLAIMRLYEKKIVSLRAAKGAFELIEKFTFQFNALTQSRGGGGVSNMYAKLAQSTTNCQTAQEFAHIANDMRDKFRERVPDETEFSVPFTRLIYRNSYTRERNIVRYVLVKLAREFGMPEEVDLSMLTIEHILPQSAGDESGDEFDVGAIGNLILMNESLNGAVSNKGFQEKMKVFSAKNNVYLDNYLLKAKKWDATHIGERGVELAQIGYNKIWKI